VALAIGAGIKINRDFNRTGVPQGTDNSILPTIEEIPEQPPAVPLLPTRFNDIDQYIGQDLFESMNPAPSQLPERIYKDGGKGIVISYPSLKDVRDFNLVVHDKDDPNNDLAL
jgi:hypothetical protein